MILAIRTDKPEAELHLLLNNGEFVDSYVWQAHRELSATIHNKINELLKKHSKAFSDIEAIVFFEGPGSFTGLRIGCSVANALGYSYNIPVVATGGDNWISIGVKSVAKNKSKKFRPISPNYGASANITTPKK